MRNTHFLLIGLLLISCIAVNYATPIIAEEPRGTRSPGAGVNLTCPTGNREGKPTDTLSYTFEINNTGDQMDNFTVVAESDNNWLMNWNDQVVGPLAVNENTTLLVNITIPMGAPANIIDNLTFSAQSQSEFGVLEQVKVNTTVIEAFVLSIDIEGRYEKTQSIDPPEVTNYTLTIRNKGNENVTITLKHPPLSLGWTASCEFENWLVAVDEANLTDEGVIDVNITITAPTNAQPDTEMTITIWGEKTDEGWYSWQYQENINITTIVKSRLNVTFTPEMTFGYVRSGATFFNFTMENSGNKDIKIDLTIMKDNLLITSLDFNQLNLSVGGLPIGNTLAVSTASNAHLGNYTINISAIDNATRKIVGAMELYYIIVPVLNITNISFSDSEPLQFKSTDVVVIIENIGYVNAKNITVNLFDGSNKVGEAHLDHINASDVAEVKIKWSPSDFGNRRIRVSLDVQREGGDGDFSNHGTSISEKFTAVNVEINWQPYYLAIFILIIIVLGVAFLSGALQLRYYKGIPHVNDYGEEAEEAGYEDHPEEPFPEDEEEEKALAPFSVAEEKEGLEEPLDYEMREERAAPMPPPRVREKPYEREVLPSMVPSKDPETLRKEDELRGEISRVEDELYKTKNLGVDTANIDQLLRTAKKSLRDGEHNKTKQYLGYANERLRNLTAKRDEALNAIKEAKEFLSGMRGTTDLTIVENFLMKADSLFEEGDYREAKNYANKAKDRAIRLQRREMRL